MVRTNASPTVILLISAAWNDSSCFIVPAEDFVCETGEKVGMEPSGCCSGVSVKTVLPTYLPHPTMVFCAIDQERRISRSDTISDRDPVAGIEKREIYWRVSGRANSRLDRSFELASVSWLLGRYLTCTGYPQFTSFLVSRPSSFFLSFFLPLLL